MIAIPNMKKPKNCDGCWALDDKYDYPMCLITQEQRGYDFNTKTRVMDFCPLIEIDLVRCGECKWWDRDGDRPFGYCHAEKHCYFSTNWEISIFRTYKSDHFCSDGERRADGDI